jgi:transcription antitermination protein NusB
MSLQPQKARELVFQLLFSITNGKPDTVEELIDLMMRECKVTRKIVTEALHRAEKVEQILPECDDYITKACREYSIDRIQSVERTILRLAIYELAIEKTLPTNVVFAEAKRLAKKFSTGEASSFVQGVLSAVAVLLGIPREETP